MTDVGIGFRSPDDYSYLPDRVAAARALTRQAAQQYVQTRRRSQATRNETRELRSETAQLRARLQDVVTTYVCALRRTDVSPERAIILVKSAMIESDSCRDKHHRHVVEEVVRWAVDAYYAA